jgi:hypothetical protein
VDSAGLSAKLLSSKLFEVQVTKAIKLEFHVPYAQLELSSSLVSHQRNQKERIILCKESGLIPFGMWILGIWKCGLFIPLFSSVWMSNVGCRMLDVGCRMLDVELEGCRVMHSSNF